jgi:malonyl-CoA O-methyltransferase
MLNKEKIKKQFSRSAENYDLHAHLQQEVGQELLKKIDITPQRILDLGCGTGTLTLALAERFPEAQIFGSDIAPGMISAAQKKALAGGFEQMIFAVEDMENVSYPDGSFDLVVSNLSLQWIDHLLETLHRLNKLLAEDGRFVFSTFGNDSLKELRTSARHMLGKGYIHEHSFVDRADLRQKLVRSGFAVKDVHSDYKERYYDSPQHLLRYLKNIGAQNASRHRPTQLMPRRDLAKLVEHYREKFGVGKKIKATYEIIFGYATVAKKSR